MVDGVYKWVDGIFLDLIEGGDSSIEYLAGAREGEDGYIEVIGENVYFQGVLDNHQEVQSFIRPLSKEEKVLVEASIVCSSEDIDDVRKFNGRYYET
jgi:hypothetical protein